MALLSSSIKSNNLAAVLGNVAFLIFVNLIVKPFWIFGIELKVQNLLGPIVYGNYFALYNFVVLFGVFLDFGINYYNNREISRHPEKLTSHFWSILKLKFFISIFYIVLVFATAKILQYTTEQINLLLFLMLNQILLFYILFFRSNLGALQVFRQDSMVSVLDKLLMIGFIGFFIWGSVVNFDIWYFVGGQTVAFLFTAIFAFVLVYKKLPTQESSESNQTKLTFKTILKESYPYALIVLLMGIYSRIDGVMLERMLSDGKMEAGIYAAAYRLLDAFSQLGYLSAAVFLPVFSKMIKQNQKVLTLATSLGILAFCASLFLAFVCWILRTDIVYFLYDAATPYYAEVFGYLMFGFVGISSVYVSGTLLAANGSLKILNIIAVLGVVLNVALNYILIPQYQALGATWATIATQTLVMLLQWIWIWQVFRNKVAD